MRGDLGYYLTYSSLIHLLFLGWIAFTNFSKEAGRVYYSVDFVSGFHSKKILQGEKGNEGEKQEAQKQGRTKGLTVDPKEDLILKSKKKVSKSEKENKRIVPPVPSLSVAKGSRPMEGKTFSEVPGLDSGIGIGLGDGNFGSGGSHFPYRWYIDSIKKKLDSNWNIASGFNARIHAEVAFTVLRDGSLRDIEIEKSSKDETFDRQVIRSIEYSDPLPPLPSNFPDSELRVHVRFSLKR